MKEWIKKHQDLIIGASVVVCSGVLLTIGCVYGMKYSEDVFNKALKGAYEAGMLKAFDGDGNAIPSGYLFSWKYYK